MPSRKDNSQYNYYDWVINRNYHQNVNVYEIASTLKLPPFIVAILFERGYRTVKAINDFLNPSLAQLYKPNQLPDIEKAVQRIIRAVKKKEAILIYGDYDVDGLTSTALLLKALRLIGANVSYYIPHRQKEGYGLSETGILYAKSHGFNLIITVDCGTTDFVEIDRTNKFGIDVIICDHHEPKEILPDAYAIINPKRIDSQYLFSELAGVGVTFKLVWALFSALNYSKESLLEYLDFVALGTISDVAPLINENRILVKFGLKRLANTTKVGLRELLKACGLGNKEITPYDVGFILGPRINAAGRLSNAEKVVRLLITDDKKEASIIATELNWENQRRQSLELAIVNDALKIIKEENLEKNKILVLASKNWHEGVIGIVASRLVELYYRPTILFSIKDEFAKGSGRSIPGFNIFQAIKFCENYLTAFGGHKYACGIILPKENIDDFTQKIQTYTDTNLPLELLIPKIYIDAEVALQDLDNNLLKIIKKFEPFGQDNPCPIFQTKGLEIVGYPRVVGKDHLKFRVRENKTKILDAIAFGHSDKILLLQKGKENHLDIVYTFDEHCFAGKSQLQLIIKDLKIH
ncbi:MAG: single-stranded-DNA-specific exonuclease RecJ [candidate division WOR-3 bacterium]